MKGAYPDYKVYLEDVKDNFETPCFFLGLTSVVSQENTNLYKNNCTLHITFFTEKGRVDALFLYDVKDTVTKLFRHGLPVGDRFLHFTSVSTETEGEDADIIFFNLPFIYYDADGQQDEKYLMQHIYNHYETKGDL